VSKDPRRWQDVIIESPHATLTKQDVHDYYATPAIRRQILNAIRSTGINESGANETIVRQAFTPDHNVLRRKDHHGSYLDLSMPGQYDEWNQQRMVEVHPTFGPKTNVLLADIDPGPDVPWRTTKTIAETIAKNFQGDSDVKAVQVQFSGDRGFYVRGILPEPIDIADARKKVRELTAGLSARPDVATNKPPKADQIRIDLSPLKNRGSVKAPYSLSAVTGLVAAPVTLEELPNLQKSDFTIEKIKTAAAQTMTFEDVKNEALRADLERAYQAYADVPDKAHGQYHIDNVINMAKRLNQRFGLPQDRVTAAAVLHDIGNVVDRKRHDELGAQMAPEYLQALPPKSQAAVIHAIREHRFSRGNPRSRLAKLINDADTVSDFTQPDYFFKRLIDYRHSHGFSPEEALTDSQQYGHQWLDKMLNQGKLRTQEAYDEVRPDLESAFAITSDPKKYKAHVQPMIDEVYGVKQAAEKTASVIRLEDLEREYALPADARQKITEEQLAALIKKVQQAKQVYAGQPGYVTKSEPVHKKYGPEVHYGEGKRGPHYGAGGLHLYKERAYAGNARAGVGRKLSPDEVAQVAKLFSEKAAAAYGEVTQEEADRLNEIVRLAREIYTPMGSRGKEPGLAKAAPPAPPGAVGYSREGTERALDLTPEELAARWREVDSWGPKFASVKRAAAEFAPGIPPEREIATIPTIKNKAWEMSVQLHKADRAGRHYDLRLVDPATGNAHSWAVPKARFPTRQDRFLLAVQQPTHTADYALGFEGDIPAGTYGSGSVKIKTRGPVDVIQANADKIHFKRENGQDYVLFRTKDNQWGFKKKTGR